MPSILIVLVRLVHAASLLTSVLVRPACVPSALYLVLLTVSLQGSSSQQKVSVVGLQTLIAVVAAVSFLVLSIFLGTPGGDDLAPWSSIWWPEVFIIVEGSVATALTLRFWFISRRHSIGIGSQANPGGSSVEGSSTSTTSGYRNNGASAIAVCLLATASAAHPCLMAAPAQLITLGILLVYGWGCSTHIVSMWSLRSMRVAQAYVSVWLAALYSVQLAGNLGGRAPPLVNNLGLTTLEWTCKSASCSRCAEHWCTELAESQVVLLLVFLFWAHFLGSICPHSLLHRACVGFRRVAGHRSQTEDAFAQARGATTESLSQPLLGAIGSSPSSLVADHPQPQTAMCGTREGDWAAARDGGRIMSSADTLESVRGQVRWSAIKANVAAIVGVGMLLMFALLSPSVTTLPMLLLGAAGIVCAASWQCEAGEREVVADSHRRPSSGCGDISFNVLLTGTAAVRRDVHQASSCLTLRSHVWMRATLCLIVTWTLAQWAVGAWPAVVQDFAAAHATNALDIGWILARVGWMPSPLLFAPLDFRLSTSVALTIHTLMVTLFVVSCRVHILVCAAPSLFYAAPYE